MDFILQRCPEQAHVFMVLETYFQLAGLRGSEPFAEQIDFDMVAYEGDFALKVSVYKDAAHEEALARFLACTLHTKVIISDDSVNPYTWVLVDERGVAQPIQEEPVEELGFFIVDERHRHLLAPCPAAPKTGVSSAS